MKKTMKSLLTLALALMLIGSLSLPVYASSKKAKVSYGDGTQTAVKVKTLSYDLDIEDEEDEEDEVSENVELKFTGRVKWQKSPEVTVSDETGASYSAELLDKDSDECDLYVEDLVEGHTYTIIIDGIKARNAASYGKAIFTFTIPAPHTDSAVPSSIQIEELEYDEEDNELEIEFKSRVRFSKDAEISITDRNGRLIDAELIEYGKDDCSIDINENLEAGETYYYSISGIRKISEKTARTLTGSFTA